MRCTLHRRCSRANSRWILNTQIDRRTGEEFPRSVQSWKFEAASLKRSSAPGMQPVANRVLDLDRVGRNWFRIESLKSKVTFLQSPLAHFSSSFKMRRAPVRVCSICSSWEFVPWSSIEFVQWSSFYGVTSMELLQIGTKSEKMPFRRSPVWIDPLRSLPMWAFFDIFRISSEPSDELPLFIHKQFQSETFWLEALQCNGYTDRLIIALAVKCRKVDGVQQCNVVFECPSLRATAKLEPAERWVHLACQTTANSKI